MKIRRQFTRLPASLAIVLLSIVPIYGEDRDRAGVREDLAATMDLTRPVDVVFCLDTSGSMQNLLDATRARIWDVVNQLGRMSPLPELHVGLLSFGTNQAGELDGWVLKHTDLTDDLDSVYAELMSLTIGGHREYVGRVLDTAVNDMNWSRDPDSLKIIFLAGNEAADQGDVAYRLAARQAMDRGVIVNALYAGNREQGIVEKWPEVAREGGGSFSAIDPETSTIQIATPHDDRLLELNRSLNTTYVPYGSKGRDGLANQVAQDSNASSLGVQSCSSRIVAKGSALYNNASWDLVDATVTDEIDLASLDADELPQEMRSLSPADRVRYVDEKRNEREAIQLEIQTLDAQREAYIKAALARERSALGLDDAMRDALLLQARAKGFTCDGC